MLTDWHFKPLGGSQIKETLSGIINLLGFFTILCFSQQMGIGLRKLDAIREQSYKAFEESIPVGLKTMINDEAHDV